METRFITKKKYITDKVSNFLCHAKKTLKIVVPGPQCCNWTKYFIQLRFELITYSNVYSVFFIYLSHTCWSTAVNEHFVCSQPCVMDSMWTFMTRRRLTWSTVCRPLSRPASSWWTVTAFPARCWYPTPGFRRIGVIESATLTLRLVRHRHLVLLLYVSVTCV